MVKKKGIISSKLPACKAKNYTGSQFKIVTSIKPDESVFVPEYKSDDSDVCELRANLPQDDSGSRKIVLPYRTVCIIDCGFFLTIPDGYKLDIRMSDESSRVQKGMIVSGYYLEKGRLKVVVMNCGKELIVINHEDVFATMSIDPIYKFEWSVE